ncbi:MAG: hypothetical protein ACJ790_08080 [Myxococcaceae bacterium]
MFRKVAAAVLVLSIAPVAAFAQSEAVKKDVKASTESTQTTTSSKKLKPKAKALSQPKTMTGTTK